MGNNTSLPKTSWKIVKNLMKYFGQKKSPATEATGLSRQPEKEEHGEDDRDSGESISDVLQL